MEPFGTIICCQCFGRRAGDFVPEVSAVEIEKWNSEIWQLVAERRFLADALFQMLGVAKKVSTRQKLNARSQPALLTLVRSKLYCRPKGERSDNK